MYLKEPGKKYRYIDTDSDTILRTLENKLYEVIQEKTFFGVNYYFQENTAYDKGVVAEAGVFKNVKEYVLDYFSEEGKEVRDAMALPNRLGLLFTGEPGTGKTFLAGQLARILSKQENAIGLTITNPSELDLGKVVDMARKNEPDRLVVMIWDEFEKDYKQGNRKSLDKMLTFLDGVDSRDNVVVIATCNDISILPDTLLTRPGRFEKVVEFKISDPIVLENLVKAMIPEKYKEKVDQQLLVDAAGKLPFVSADAIKSLIRDSLVNLLKGKTDIIPKDEDRATRPEPKPDKGKKKDSRLKRRVCREDLSDLIWDDDLDEGETITIEQLIEKVSQN